MAKVRIDLGELDLDTVALVESLAGKQVSAAQTRTIVAGFLVGDDGEPLSPEEAVCAAGRLKLREAREVLEELNTVLEALKEEAVPKATGQPS